MDEIEHFMVDGTPLKAWACLKCFRPKDSRLDPPEDPGNPTVDFHGQTRSNQTHESTPAGDAKLARKRAGKEAKLSYSSNLLIEDLNGLIEECFGWMKDIALLRKLKHRGLNKVGWIFSFAAAAYNLVRLRKLIPVAAGIR